MTHLNRPAEVRGPIRRKSAVFCAAEGGHVDTLRALVRFGASVEHAAADGATPLAIAAHRGHYEVVSALLEAGADQAVRTPWGTALFVSAQEGHLEVVRALVETGGASVDQVQENGTTPLFVSAQQGHLEVVRALVEAGADLSICMVGNSWSPLFVAAWSGHVAVVVELLQHGADCSTATAQEHLEIPAGSTALSVAQLKGHQGVVDLLSFL